ncbi:hypothetical protein TrLO_g292 [Triparma laevis f. longispina]|uniref:Uncharacterized protein n=1 Tax=Triparma laevis f. longispina TaxID=1714387 RepID=A0A9W7KXH0_9STRA|nr:hypothetical protein TrLO_g292 [Triparma laevis f. longispina]
MAKEERLAEEAMSAELERLAFYHEARNRLDLVISELVENAENAGPELDEEETTPFEEHENFDRVIAEIESKEQIFLDHFTFEEQSKFDLVMAELVLNQHTDTVVEDADPVPELSFEEHEICVCVIAEKDSKAQLARNQYRLRMNQTRYPEPTPENLHKDISMEGMPELEDCDDECDIEPVEGLRKKVKSKSKHKSWCPKYKYKGTPKRKCCNVHIKHPHLKTCKNYERDDESELEIDDEKMPFKEIDDEEVQDHDEIVEEDESQGDAGADIATKYLDDDTLIGGFESLEVNEEDDGDGEGIEDHLINIAIWRSNGNETVEADRVAELEKDCIMDLALARSTKEM